MEFVDPHCHYWITDENSPSGHVAKAGAKSNNYLLEDYLNDMKLTGLIIKKSVFVEAISEDAVAEVNWVTQIVSQDKNAIAFKIVAYADLSVEREALLVRLNSYAKNPFVVGIRQILNHHKNPALTWPKVASEYLLSETWRNNFKLLSGFSFTFDLQINPHQINDALPVLKENLNCTIILDHLLCIHFGQGDEEDLKNLQIWRSGIQELAKLPNVYMKLSMLPFVKSPQDNKFDAQVRGLVIEAITVFTTKRCMFASNFPVDKENIGSKEMYSEFLSFVENYNEEEKRDLFYSTASKAYKL